MHSRKLETYNSNNRWEVYMLINLIEMINLCCNERNR